MMDSTKEKTRLFSFRFIFSVLFVFCVCFIALFAHFIAPHDPLNIDLSKKLCPLSQQNLLGCNLYGSDLLSQIIFGARVSLFIAIITSGITTFIGVLLGLVSGFFR